MSVKGQQHYKTLGCCEYPTIVFKRKALSAFFLCMDEANQNENCRFRFFWRPIVPVQQRFLGKTKWLALALGMIFNSAKAERTTYFCSIDSDFKLA